MAQAGGRAAVDDELRAGRIARLVAGQVDDQVGDLLGLGDPAQRRRIDARVFAWLEASDTPLAMEWLQLVRASPLAALGLGTVSAASIAITPPFVWLARVLL